MSKHTKGPFKVAQINKNSEAYHTGYEARVQGDSAVCPYPACDYRHHDWMAGYADAA